MESAPSMASATQWKLAFLPVQGRQRDGRATFPQAVWRGSPFPHPPSAPAPPKRMPDTATPPGGDAQRTGRPPPGCPPCLPPPPHTPTGTTPPRPHGPTPVGARVWEPGRVTRGPGRRPHTRQAQHRTRAGIAKGHEPPGKALPAPCTGTAQSARVTQRRAERAPSGSTSAQTHTTSTRCAPEGQPEGARGTHRPREIAYRQPRASDPRT